MPQLQQQSSTIVQPNQYELTDSTIPRYGPLPSLARVAGSAVAAAAAAPMIGSAPLHRRLRPIPPPAYSDLDECDSDRGTNDPEPRYQPMPLHLIHTRRPLPSQPMNGGQVRSNTKSITSPSSSGGDSVEGDYEDISQL